MLPPARRQEGRRIFFLQTKQLVPSFKYLADGETSQSAGTLQPLSLLLRGFFEFLTARNGSSTRGLSVIRAEEFEAPAPEQGAAVTPLFLEDPAALQESNETRNMIETLGEPQWARICEESKKAVKRLAARPQRWFHWAEIFDPRIVPADKIQYLLPLQEAVNATIATAGC